MSASRETVHVAAADGRTCELCRATVAGELQKPFAPAERVVVLDGNAYASWVSSWRLPNCTQGWRRESEVACQQVIAFTS